MSNPTFKRYKIALEEVRKANAEGLLLVDDVIEAARAEDHPLHGYFDWDDAAAAHKFRREQARRLIRLVVEEAQDVTFQAYVSLRSDRYDEGGYRPLAEVVTTADLRAEYVGQCLQEIDGLRAKYGRFQELSAIWEAADEVKRSRPRRQLTNDAPIVQAAAD